jgi:WD40 repeat protein
MLAAMDGSVVVYDMKNNRVDFKSAAGHTETIFACKFSPHSPHCFATGSYDGTIKIWATDTLALQKTLVGNGDIIYCLDWSPTGKMIATSSYTGLITIWDVDNGRELARYLNHSKAAFFVAWNHRDERYLLTSSADCSVLLLELDFEVLYSDVSTAKSISSRKKSADSHKDNLSVSVIKRRYQHDSQVFGIAWSTFHKDLFCTCSQDNFVRVFNALMDQTVPILKLPGHSARVFSSTWSPLVEGMLATGSDDYSIIVWKIERLQEPSKCTYSQKKLVGHKGYVRALSWNYESADLLLSGSWDNSIRMWDVTTGSSLYELNEHIADVYALTSTPFRPCSYVSASRDTTVRVWELQGHFTLMRYYAVWDENLGRSRNTKRNIRFDELSGCKLNTVVPSMVQEMLSGKESLRLERILSDEMKKGDAEKFYRLFYFFSSSSAYLDVWENCLKLLETASNTGSSFGFLRPSSLRQIFHETEVLSIAKASIKAQDSSKYSRKQDDAVAMMYCKLGDFQNYCQWLVEEGKWEAALAIAPTVSIQYWQRLAQEYAKVLRTKGSEECIPYLIGINRYEDAVEFYLNRNESNSAMIVAKSAQVRPHVIHSSDIIDQTISSKDNNSIVDRVGFFEADKLAQRGQPLLAGAKLIAIGRVDEAISMFVTNHELDLAFAVSKVFGRDPTPVLTIWAERCAFLGAIDLAVEIVQQGSGAQKDIDIALLLSKYCDVETAERMMQSLRLQSISTWTQIAQEEEATGSDNEAVVAYIISREYERAAQIAINSLSRYVQDPWSASPQNKKLFNSSKRIRATGLTADTKLLFLVTMLWFSAHEAIICGALRTAVEMLNVILDYSTRVKFPIPEALIQLHMGELLVLLGDNYGKNLFTQLRHNSQLVLLGGALDDLIRTLQDEESWNLWANLVNPNTWSDSINCSNKSEEAYHPKIRSLAR